MADESEVNAPGERQDSLGVTFVLLGLGVCGISFSGPIVVALTVPALAVAFWRNAFGALVSAMYAGVRSRGELTRLARERPPGLWMAVAAGSALCAHFALWVPSLRLTTVAASTALVTMTPIWTVVIDRLSGRPVPRGVVIGVALALMGVLVVTGVDAARSGRALTGDALALSGGVFAAVYMSAGEVSRRSVSTAAYTLVAYTTCSVGLLLICLVGRQRLAGRGFDARTWALLVLLTVLAQVFGHTLFNRALAVVGATTVALAILLETPGAALVAWVWVGQRPPALIIPGAALLLVGIGLVLVSRRHRGAGPSLAPAG